MKSTFSTKNVIMTGMFAAVLAVLSQIQIPMPSGVPVTMQTFAVALTGYVLGMKFGTVATIVYVLLGAVGVPVYAGFHGGFQTLVGATGGFIWGFILMTALCGAAYSKKHIVCVVLSAIGLAACHIPGILQFMAVMKMGFAESAMLASVPYLVKDVISVIAAYIVARAVRRGLSAAGIQTAAV